MATATKFLCAKMIKRGTKLNVRRVFHFKQKPRKQVNGKEKKAGSDTCLCAEAVILEILRFSDSQILRFSDSQMSIRI